MHNNIVIILLSVLFGILLGECASEQLISGLVLVVRDVSSQVIFFLVPLIVLAFVASAVTSLQGNATRLFLFAFAVAYASGVMSALFSLLLSHVVVPLLAPVGGAPEARPLPEALFSFSIPPLMNVISALFLAVLLGLGTAWTKARAMSAVLVEFREIMLLLVRRVLLPVLPAYVAANFCVMAWQGSLGRLAVFLPVIGVVVVAHLVWIVVLYGLASLYSRRNAFEILSHYARAYLTALGTMSSAATLGVALDCAGRSRVLRRDVSGFTIPLFANIHLCGATLTEVFFLSVVSVLLYGRMPDATTFALFIVLLGVFAVGAPGVPGGTAFASVGIVVSVLGFGDDGTALFLALFALQDSFGTGCNILGDGALSLIVQTYGDRNLRSSGG